MALAAPRPCTYPGCGVLTRTGRCERHPLPASNWQSDRRRGSRHQRGYGADWERKRERILQRDNYLCQVCLAEGRLEALVVGNPRHPLAAHVDHKIPKAQGGTDDDDNLQAISRRCHERKTAREGRGGGRQAGGDGPGRRGARPVGAGGGVVKK